MKPYVVVAEQIIGPMIHDTSILVCEFILISVRTCRFIMARGATDGSMCIAKEKKSTCTLMEMLITNLGSITKWI